ncbi:MAG: acetolactate synthase large subunit [Betaproteobacteria bacterium]|nr:MAG: acetolactate synthase large subunit [Betaproteobacteria bacterium]
MNGAEALARTLVAAQVEVCFANPGTSEMHFVSALDRVPGLRCVLGLAETVVAGCADGYGRMAGKPAATLLHCGPGLANGLANFHNARRAFTPIVSIVGDHATYHRPHDAPLTADTEALARTVSHWVRTSASAADVAADAAAAVQAARTPPGGIATLVLPADCAWNEGAQPAGALAPPPRAAVTPQAMRDAARALRSGEPAMLLLSNEALGDAGLRAAQRVAHASGALLRTPTQVPRMARGRGRASVDRIPYAVDAALKVLAGTKHLILAGAKPPVGFFAYPGKPSTLWPRDCTLHVLARPEQDAIGALEALADELGAPRAVPVPDPGPLPELQRGPFRPDAFGQALAARLPEQAIVAEDAVTSGRALFASTFAAAPHDWIQLTGGAIGHAFPAATGAAIACPERKVVCLQADGAGMYSLQALWTQARERLDVVNVVFANRRYAILQGELAAVGAAPGPASRELFDLARPEIRWTRLAEGMGVEAARVATLEAFADAFRAACARRGPFLIEFLI